MEGTGDDAIRHLVSKRIIYTLQVQNYIENALESSLLDKLTREKNLHIELSNPYDIVPFHLEFLDNSSSEFQCTELIKTIGMHDVMNYIITKGNADVNGYIISDLFCEYEKFVSDSFDMIIYLNTVRYSEMVIRNSSSGLIEVPLFYIPTANIGIEKKEDKNQKVLLTVKLKQK